MANPGISVSILEPTLYSLSNVPTTFAAHPVFPEKIRVNTANVATYMTFLTLSENQSYESKTIRWENTTSVIVKDIKVAGSACQQFPVSK